MQHEKMLRNTAEKNIKEQISNIYNTLREMKENHETIWAYWPKESRWLRSSRPALTVFGIMQYKECRTRIKET